MIQTQGTGDTPVTDTAEQPPGRRYGTFPYEVTEAAPGANRHYGPDQADSEVSS